jgi:hypothetical protein
VERGADNAFEARFFGFDFWSAESSAAGVNCLFLQRGYGMSLCCINGGANQPGGYIGLDESAAATAHITPRFGTLASLLALAGTDDEPEDKELCFITDIGGG